MHRGQNHIREIDWGFLVFLLGSCHVKIYVKGLALIFFMVYLIYRKARFPLPPSYIWFYGMLILIGTLSSALGGSFSDPGYPFGWAFGTLVFLLAGSISYLIYVAATLGEPQKLMATIKAFFGLNALYSLFIFLGLILDSGHIMPYWYWDPQEMYGSSTGDYLMGVFHSNSVTNAMVNLLGLVFFAYHRQFRWAVLCLVICLMCTSNLTILFLLVALAWGIVTASKRDVRRQLIYLLLLTMLCYPLLSPSNLKYIKTTIEQGRDQEKLADGRGLTPADEAEVPKPQPRVLEWEDQYRQYLRQAQIPATYRMPLHSPFHKVISDLRYDYVLGTPWDPPQTNRLLKESYTQGHIQEFYGMTMEESPISYFYQPIKLYSFRQTGEHMRSGWKTAFLGSGMGNFSSKLALKMTGLQMQGDYPFDRLYVHEDFLRYHFYTLLYVFSLPVSQHSTINMPNSVYNQLGGEYGLVGMGLLVLAYFGFFFRRAPWRSAGMVMLVLLVAFFGFEYWLEMISLTLIFELIFLYFDRVHDPKSS